MASSCGKKKIIEAKSLCFVMNFGCIFVKIKPAFVAKIIPQLKTFKYIFPHYSWMPGLTLPQNPKECWQVLARKEWDEKFVALWNIVVVSLLLLSDGVIIYGGCYYSSISTAS